MNAHSQDGRETGISVNADSYSIFEMLKYPVLILGIDGVPLYGNEAYRHFFHSDDSPARLDWEHPFFPEYRKRIAQSYIGALNGDEKQCFAIVNTPDGVQRPVEIYLFPMMRGESVVSILAMMIIVDQRLLSFDRSTLSIISEENFQYDNIHYEYSPMPLLRCDRDMNILKCSHSFENLIGATDEEILVDKQVTIESLFTYDAEKIKKATGDIFSGNNTFHRVGEAKINVKGSDRKIVNLTLYPIVQNNAIASVEIIMEDITRIRELRDTINAINRVQLFSDITKGFLHSLKNTLNVIMSRTQLLQQITEKVTVIEGIQHIEKSAHDIADQVKRIENFIESRQAQVEEHTEKLVDIIEDSIEFSKMQFKVDGKDNIKLINVEKKYYSDSSVRTNTRLLREILTSIILKVSNFILKEGTIEISLKQNHDLCFMVGIRKDENIKTQSIFPDAVNIFSGIDIRQAAEAINLKIIEEESAQQYSLRAIFPARSIVKPQSDAREGEKYRIRDLDILIVEDELDLQRILQELFDRMGNRVRVYDNGKEALDAFKAKPYDIVITDYGISGITGIELAARIKEINEDVITVLLSGWMLDDIKTYTNVVDLYLAKPFKLDALLNHISRIILDKKGSPVR